MKVTLWGINYEPELVGIGVYNSELAEFLARSGTEVTVVTSFPYYPTWKKKAVDKRCLYRTEILETEIGSPITLCRCWLYVPSIPTVGRRILHEASFALSSFLRLLSLPAADVYVVVAPPLLLAVAAWFLSLIKLAPVMVHVQDLQPDAALSLNMLKPGLFTNLLLMLEKFAYAKATVVSSISKELCAIIESKGVSPAKLFLLPNWVDKVDQAQLPQPGSWKRENGISPETRIVSYAGNLGVKQGLEVIVKVAQELQGKLPVLFVIAGNGGNESELKRLVHDFQISNVIFKDVMPVAEHTALLVDSDLCIIPQKPGASSHFLPSKLLKILALGRPVISNSQPGGALHEAFMEGRFGVIVSRYDHQEMVAAITALLADDELRTEFGQAGLRYVAQFEKTVVLVRLQRLLARLTARAKKTDASITTELTSRHTLAEITVRPKIQSECLDE